MKATQKAVRSIFTDLGVRRVEDLFYKVHSELVSTVSEVRMEKIICSSCKEKTLDTWIYKQGNEWLEDPVWSICNDCQKEAYAKEIGVSLISKRQKVIDEEWYFINEADKAGFKNFDTPTPETMAAKEASVEYVKTLIAGETRNLRISGTPGTGKTHLAIAIARTFKHQGKSVAFVGANKLFEKVRSTFGNDHAKKELEKHFSSFDLVVIDDVGVETSNPKEVSWTSSEWVNLIDLRERKSTVYTTNFDEKKLAGVIGARAESRMSANADLVELYTPDKDYRKLDIDKDKLFY